MEPTEYGLYGTQQIIIDGYSANAIKNKAVIALLAGYWQREQNELALSGKSQWRHGEAGNINIRTTRMEQYIFKCIELKLFSGNEAYQEINISDRLDAFFAEVEWMRQQIEGVEYDRSKRERLEYVGSTSFRLRNSIIIPEGIAEIWFDLRDLAQYYIEARRINITHHVNSKSIHVYISNKDERIKKPDPEYIQLNEGEIYFPGTLGQLIEEAAIRKSDPQINERRNKFFRELVGPDFNYHQLIESVFPVEEGTVDIIMGIQIPKPDLYVISTEYMVKALREVFGLQIRFQLISFADDLYVADASGVKYTYLDPVFITTTSKGRIIVQGGNTLVKSNTSKDKSVSGLEGRTLSSIEVTVEQISTKNPVRQILEAQGKNNLSLLELHSLLLKHMGIDVVVDDIQSFNRHFFEILFSKDPLELLKRIHENSLSFYEIIRETGKQKAIGFREAATRISNRTLKVANLRPSEEIYYASIPVYLAIFTDRILFDDLDEVGFKFTNILNSGIKKITHSIGVTPLIARSNWIMNYKAAPREFSVYGSEVQGLKYPSLSYDDSNIGNNHSPSFKSEVTSVAIPINLLTNTEIQEGSYKAVVKAINHVLKSTGRTVRQMTLTELQKISSQAIMDYLFESAQPNNLSEP